MRRVGSVRGWPRAAGPSPDAMVLQVHMCMAGMHVAVPVVRMHGVRIGVGAGASAARRLVL